MISIEKKEKFIKIKTILISIVESQSTGNI